MIPMRLPGQIGDEWFPGRLFPKQGGIRKD